MTIQLEPPLEARTVDALPFNLAGGQPGGLLPPRGPELDLAELWQDLVTGRRFMHDAQYVDGHCFVVFDKGHGIPVAPLARQILERALIGERLKVLSIELGLSPSTTSQQCVNALSAFGYESHLRRVPILLVAAVHAAYGVDLPRVTSSPSSPRHRFVVSFEIPGSCWRARLSSAEREVTNLILQGRSHREIASARQTAIRTTANQISSVFQKVGVSGRSELRALAVLTEAGRQERRPS